MSKRAAVDSYLAGMDADMDSCAVGLLTLHTLNVDDVLLPVDLDNFANLLAFVVSPDNLQTKALNHLRGIETAGGLKPRPLPATLRKRDAITSSRKRLRSPAKETNCPLIHTPGADNTL